MTLSPVCDDQHRNGVLRELTRTHLDGLSHQATLNAEMQSRLSFGDEVKLRVSRSVVVNQSSEYSCLAHLAPLQALPFIRVRENEVDLVP